MQTPSEANTQKGGIGWVWSMTGGLISRMSGGKPGPKSVPARSKKKGFWNKRQTKLPGTVKQVRGAQYPPLTGGATPVSEQPDSKFGSRPSTAKMTPIEEKKNLEKTTGFKGKGVSEAKEASDSATEPQEKKKEKTVIDKKTSANALSKRAQIFRLINEPHLDMSQLRRRSWSGLCPAVRADVWQLILGYQPTNRQRRGPTMAKRRKEYKDFCRKYYLEDESEYSSSEKKIMHQIDLDTPRTLPGVKLLQHKSIQTLLRRTLYIWSIRHPASGYVQGMNDLVVPFLFVFLASKVGVEPTQLEEKHLLPEHLDVVEADCFWCLSKLLDGIQDHYTASQPGIQRMVYKLQELIHRLDKPLHEHLKKHQIRFFDFAYKWMNCLLMREVSLELIIRVWDTYIAEPEGFTVFHVYMCAAMLKKFSPELVALKDFQDLILYLQNLPTEKWTEKVLKLCELMF